MPGSEIFGNWVAAFLTLCIFSFLIKDNPLYKFAEHIFIGVSAGYWMAISYQQVLIPKLVNQLRDGDYWSLVPLVLGIILILRLVPRISWISRWTLAFLVGITAGFQIVYTMEAQVLKQVSATVLPLVTGATLTSLILNWIVVFGVMCGLVYFYFSVEHKGVFFGGASRVGIYVLMIAFGASFGYTVMARVSLLIGRMLFFRDDFWPTVLATFRLGG